MGLSAPVVIVGGSTAGLATARELRDLGHDGPLTVVSDEAEPGYQRPPLSKRGLREELPPADAAAGLDLEVVLGTATGLAPSVVELAGGRTLPFDRLVIATGARPRRLAAPGQTGELVLRSREDAADLRAALARASSAIVVGAGFLGMEVAGACLAHGLAVTVVDVDRPLERLLGGFVSRLVQDRLAAAGGRFLRGRATLLGSPVNGVDVDGGRARLSADVVVTCVGDVPNVKWLAGSGVHLADGVVVDGRGRTNLPSVFAAGDVVCAAWGGNLTRRPFWANAMTQGRLVAHSLLGLETPVPLWDDYFWTEVMGCAVKVTGPTPLAGEPDAVEGTPEEGALFRWDGPHGPTLVAWGHRLSAARLRRLRLEPPEPAPAAAESAR
ncbi:NAD(P)/FAD-dependent oxidoreductase [Spongisporangium articulatum]|uniref:NAD(P)/FAD-dependent oxidoreductase n=1 Tax=Spongisporangium articulatum TaxID=3362603 RepID=A0ABW8AV24_9ACTN